MSDEHKQKISVALKGKPKSPEQIEKMRLVNLGKKYPGRVNTWSGKCLVTPWGEFATIKLFLTWAKQVGLPNAKENLDRARKELPDQFYIKD